MSAFLVVEALDVVEDGHPGHVPVLEDAPVEQFAFQRGKEALSDPLEAPSRKGPIAKSRLVHNAHEALLLSGTTVDPHHTCAKGKTDSFGNDPFDMQNPAHCSIDCRAWCQLLGCRCKDCFLAAMSAQLVWNDPDQRRWNQE